MVKKKKINCRQSETPKCHVIELSICHRKQILESNECLKVCTRVNSTDEKYFMDFISHILYSPLFLCYTTALAKYPPLATIILYG